MKEHDSASQAFVFSCGACKGGAFHYYLGGSESHMEERMNYYRKETVTAHVTTIRSLSGEILYLIEGTNEAVLIDTCVGVGHLRKFVETLTDKPIKVLLSHGHIDHAMGAPEFDTVYLNFKDIPLYQSQCALAGRMGYVSANIGEETAKTIAPSEYVAEQPDYCFHALTDGMVFDLGEIHVEAHAFPGHTPGCMIFLIPEERILILGDACNNATFLFDDICSSVEAYREQVKQVRTLLDGKYERVFLMHHVMDAPSHILSEMVTVCDTVLAGEDDHVPFHFFEKTAYIAKRANERFECLDGGFANLIYNPEKLV